MKMKIIACLALIAALPAGAAEVHKWVDEEGIVHYSGSPPAQCAEDATVEASDGIECAEIKTFELTEDYEQPERVEENYYSIANQAERLEAAREEREEERAAREAEVERERLFNLLSASVLRDDYDVAGGFYGGGGVYPIVPPPYYKPHLWPHRLPLGKVPHFKPSPHHFRHPRAGFKHPGILNNPPPRPGAGFGYRGGTALDLD